MKLIAGKVKAIVSIAQRYYKLFRSAMKIDSDTR